MDSIQFLNSFFSHSSDGMLLLDAELSALQANTVFYQLTGFDEDTILAKDLHTIFPASNDGVDSIAISKKLENDRIWQGEFSYVNGQGETRRLVTTILPLTLADSASSHWLAIFKSLTLQNYTESQISSASFDALTELPGPVIFYDRVEQALHISRRQNQPVALLLIDLDRFARINDGLGREYGDHVLQEIARRIKCSLRESDSAARITGDNFCLLIAD